MPTESIKFTCTYCGKAFSRERTLHVHMCEPKRRHLQKHEKWVQNAFIVFQRFYEVNQKHLRIEKKFNNILEKNKFCKDNENIEKCLGKIHKKTSKFGKNIIENN